MQCATAFVKLVEFVELVELIVFIELVGLVVLAWLAELIVLVELVLLDEMSVSLRSSTSFEMLGKKACVYYTKNKNYCGASPLAC